MKRMILLAGIAAVVLLVAGCSAGQEPVTESEEEKPVETKEESPGPIVVGGWIIPEDGSITSELQQIFNEAMADLTGVSYTPVRLMETQIVSGTNYRFLCESTVIYPDAPAKMAYVTIYQDLNGKAEVIDIQEVIDDDE